MSLRRDLLHAWWSETHPNDMYPGDDMVEFYQRQELDAYDIQQRNLLRLQQEKRMSDGRVLEKKFDVAFQCDPNAEPGEGPRYIRVADDGRLELQDGDGRLWRCHIVKLFAELESAESVGVVYVETSIKLDSKLLLNPPGVKMEGIDGS